MVEGVASPSLAWEQMVQWANLIPDGVLVVNRQGLVVMANTAIQTLSGRTGPELVGQPMGQLLAPELRARHQANIQQFFAAPALRPMGRVANLNLWTLQGEEVPVDISLGLFRMGDERLALAVVRDVSPLRALHAKAEYLAMHDELTGLYSRYMFTELLTQAVMQALRSGRPMALLLIDLDDFKSVNDGHGHHVGDRLLCEVAHRMKAALRAEDVLARLGGDEFAVLLRDPDAQQAAPIVAEKLLAAIGQPWRLGHHDVAPGASIGIVYAPGDGSSGDLLMRRADMAMYRAKEAGRSTYVVYDAEMARRTEERVQLQSRLKRALQPEAPQPEALSLHYQPQLCARSGRVVGLEALLRWQDAALGSVSPARFVPVAESCGLIHPLGDWVLETSCRQIAHWHRQGLALRVAVNVSAHQLRLPSFAERLARLIERWAVPPELLELEITESAAMSSGEQARELLLQVAALGVGLALDDFGMGYSSLGHLRELPVTRLKIDRSFVRGVTVNQQDAVLTRAVIALAQTLGKTVVGEGVETEAQRDFLQREGCDVMQGWLFARAVPAAELPEVLRQLERKASQDWLVSSF